MFSLIFSVNETLIIELSHQIDAMAHGKIDTEHTDDLISGFHFFHYLDREKFVAEYCLFIEYIHLFLSIFIWRMIIYSFVLVCP